MSETMTMPRVPGVMTLDRGLWAGRMMSAFVVIALVADATIELVAPAQMASMFQEVGFAMGLTPSVGPIILACAILYAMPATRVLGAILVTGFLGRRHLRPCPHWRVGVAGGNLLLAAGRADVGRPLHARSPYPGHSASHSLNQPVRQIVGLHGAGPRSSTPPPS